MTSTSESAQNKYRRGLRMGKDKRMWPGQFQAQVPGPLIVDKDHRSGRDPRDHDIFSQIAGVTVFVDESAEYFLRIHRDKCTLSSEFSKNRLSWKWQP